MILNKLIRKRDSQHFFTVVVCSVEQAKTNQITRHYATLFKGQAYELLIISDARSLAEGYNRAIRQANGDVIIFSHDDIEFLAPATWLTRLQKHLEHFDLVGLAGTTRLIGPAWAAAGPPYTYGRVGELDGQQAPYRMLYCGNPTGGIGGIQAVDGLFFAVRRNVLNSVQFDETNFDGFHCYDVDFTYSAYRAGFRLGVATDLAVLHQSQGHFDKTWAKYAQRFLDKFAPKLHPMPQRRFQHGLLYLQSKAELLEALTYDAPIAPR